MALLEKYRRHHASQATSDKGFSTIQQNIKLIQNDDLKYLIFGEVKSYIKETLQADMWLIVFIYLQTHIQGLTGNISFDELGYRTNFSVDIVEMTVNSEMVKVSVVFND